MFRKFTFLFSVVMIAGLMSPISSLAQCTTTNATSCQCLVPGQTDCDLLPDIGISWYGLQNHMGGPTEYAQTGQGAENGHLRVSGATPNYGRGPFTVGAVDRWVCGVDTFDVFPGVCGDGSAPKQLIWQKIYHKNGNVMSYSQNYAGTMTYHTGHGHMHVDDWCIFTLRIPNADPNPLNWPIVGEGAKLGFCLMDYGTCSGYNGFCRDSITDVTMVNGDFINYGLGGGSYGCSPVEQGISVGYTDIYSENLADMFIVIPPGTCNGNYEIVIQADPHNVFLESNEGNNVAHIPFTLTQQNAPGNPNPTMSASGSTDLCPSESVTLTANTALSYSWSTGATTQSITVSTAGTYTCTVTDYCGTASVSKTVTVNSVPAAPTTTDDEICGAGSGTLVASGTAPFAWFDAAAGGNQVGSSATFNTPTVASTTTYYVESQVSVPGTNGQLGPVDNTIGTGANHNTDSRYLEFNALVPFTLNSVWVQSATAGNRTVEVRDAAGASIDQVTVNIPAGASTVNLGLNVPQGNNLRLGLLTGSMVDMYRNDAGVSYPYTLTNIASIINSSAGTQYYYWFYDWDVTTAPKICATTRVPATVTVNALPTVSFSGLAASYFDSDAAVTLTGTPAGGTFSGPGVSGNTFDPALAGVGGPYTITYTYTDANGCTNTFTQDVNVQLGVGILDEPGAANEVFVFPNPNNGNFNMRFQLKGSHKVHFTVSTLSGQVIYTRDLGTFTGMFSDRVNLGEVAKGIYIVDLNVDGELFHSKLTVE